MLSAIPLIIWCSFVLLGCPHHRIVTKDPEMSSFLPDDDAVWDQGVNFLN
jgi:hypothetical protein